MATATEAIQHVLRRAGFGAIGLSSTVDALVNYETQPDDVDTFIGRPGYAGVTSRGEFQPNTRVSNARQRWLFRMVHTARPLQEKMALFWPLRHRPHQDRRDVRRHDGHPDDGGQAVRGRGGRARADRALSQQCPGQLPRPARPGRSGPGDAGVAGRHLQHEGEAPGKLRPGAHGAVHHGRRPLHRGRRLRCGPRVHRLEPAPGRQQPA